MGSPLPKSAVARDLEMMMVEGSFVASAVPLSIRKPNIPGRSDCAVLEIPLTVFSP